MFQSYSNKNRCFTVFNLIKCAEGNTTKHYRLPYNKGKASWTRDLLSRAVQRSCAALGYKLLRL